MWFSLFVVALTGYAFAWHRVMNEIKRTPEGAFAAVGSSRKSWESTLWFAGFLGVPLYYLRFRRHLRRAAERATELPPAWYPDQDDPSLERWWDGHSWTDLVR